MKNNLLRIIAAFLTIGMTAELSAGVIGPPAATQVTPNFVTRWNRIAGEWSKSRTEKTIEQRLRTLEISFNPQFEKADAAYYKTNLMQLEEFPLLKKTENGVMAYMKSNPQAQVEIIYVGGSDFLLNGKKFTYNRAQDMKANFAAIDALFASAARPPHILDQLLLPRAEALGVLGWVLIAAVVGVGAWLLFRNKNKVKEKRDEIHGTVRDAHRNHKDYIKDKVD